MPLTIPPVPDSFFAALQPTLHAWAADLDSAPALMRRILRPGGPPKVGPVQAEPIAVSSSFELFTLPADSLATASPLTSARSIGWRFALTPGGSSPASPVWMDYSPAIGAAAPTLAAIHQTPFHANLVSALAAAESNPQVAVSACSAAILETSALYQIALWLRESGDSSGLLIPIASPYPSLQLGVAYSAAAYTAALQAILASRVKPPHLANAVTTP